MQRSHAASSSHHHRSNSMQSDLAIKLYGYGLAAARVTATEGMTPRSASASARTPRSSRMAYRGGSTRSSNSATPRSARSPASASKLRLSNQWNLRPNQQFDVRARLSVTSQRLMEVADVSFLHAASLVAADDRSSHNGQVNVHETVDLDSKLVATLPAHTRLYVVDSKMLNDGTKRALVVLEGDNAPLGWASATTPEGQPLIYMFARPLYEVGQLPLKVRMHFDQTSRFRKQLAPGTRMHVTETRRTNDGAQRVCIVLLGEEDAAGWVTSIKPDGKRTLIEVKGLDGSGSPRSGSPRTGRRGSMYSDADAKYLGMSSDAIEQAALEFVSQRHSFIPSSELHASVDEVMRQAHEVVSKLTDMTANFFEGGQKPLSVQLGEILQRTPFSLEEMMAEAEGSGSNPEITGKVSKMEFRMYLRKLLDRKCMLSSMTGAAEIDTIFPMLDTNGDGEIDIKELEAALVMLEAQRAEYQAKVDKYRTRDARYKEYAATFQTVLDATVSAEEACHARDAEKLKSTGPQLGVRIQYREWTAAQVASMWIGDATSIDKASFRREAIAIGVEAETYLIDELFDSLCNGSMNESQLEAALQRQMQLADALKATFRRLNIRIIESTKKMKAIQAAHRLQMDKWAIFIQSERERDAREAAEEEAQRAESKSERVKRHTAIGGAPASGVSSSRNGGKAQNKSTNRAAAATRAPSSARGSAPVSAPSPSAPPPPAPPPQTPTSRSSSFKRK